jgi:hypothetical protein
MSLFKNQRVFDNKRKKRTQRSKDLAEYEKLTDEELAEELDFYSEQKINLRAKTKKINQEIGKLLNVQNRRLLAREEML